MYTEQHPNPLVVQIGPYIYYNTEQLVYVWYIPAKQIESARSWNSIKEAEVAFMWFIKDTGLLKPGESIEL